MGEIGEDSPVYLESCNSDRKVVVDYGDAIRLANIKFREHDEHVKSSFGNFPISKIIVEPEPGHDVHHDNEDTYDNRRKNLMEKEHGRHSHLTNRKIGGIRKRKKTVSAVIGQHIGKLLGTLTEVFPDAGKAERFIDWISYVKYGTEAVLNSPGHICSALAVYMMMHNGGDYFEVLFIRRIGGTLRRMKCRYVDMDPESFSKISDKQLIPVTLAESEEKVPGDTGFRVIPIEGIKELTIGGKTYLVSPE
jgi:hypothetical protein